MMRGDTSLSLNSLNSLDSRMSTSISSSSPTAVNNEQHTFSGQKRRPIDPPEDDVGTSSSATTLYDSELMHQHKRPRTIDELGLSFSRNSLSAPDPPGNYSAGSKRKNDDYDVFLLFFRC